MKTLKDIDVLGKRVLVRADLDVNVEQLPLRQSSGQAVDSSSADAKALADKQLTEVTRLRNLKPTVDYLISHKAKQIIIAGHIGRPENRRVGGIGEIGKSVISDESESQINQIVGEPDFYDEKLSTKNLAPVLEKLLGQKITFSSQLTVNSSQPEGTVNSEQITHNQIFLLENLRFWEGEEKNDPEFAKQLASLADIYINEAFGVCHRAHASIVGVPTIFAHVEDPEHSRRAAGLHLEEEVNQLTKVIKNPQRPMAAIIGGAKLETKIPVIESLSKVADWVLVGGLIAKEIMNSKNYSPVILEGAQRPIGSKSGIDSIALLQNDRNESKVIVAELTEDTKDISDESIEKFSEIIKTAKTVVWNGPVGYFEGGFERGTLAIAQAIIDSGAYSAIGGGETTEFLGSKGLLDKFSFVSSGGGAMLEFLAGRELPGLNVLA